MQPNQDTLPLIPTDAYLFFPTDKETKNCSGARLMFDGNLKLDAYELKMVAQFKAHAQKNNYTLKSMWTDSMVVRFLQANGFKMDKTLTAVKEHTIWRETRLPARLSDPVKKFLEKGYLYIHGRDHKFRPIVVFSAYLIEVKNFDVDLMIEALTYFFSYMIENILLPGQVENWIFITDLKGMGLGSMPLNPIRKLLGYLQHNYRGRLYVMYIVNAPSSVYIPWQMVKGFLEESTVKKIQFLKKQIPEPLMEHTNKEQIEEKYGGIAPNLTKFWPPIVPSNNYFLRKEESRCLVSKEDYKIMYGKGILEKHTINMQLIQDNVQAEQQNYNSNVTSETKYPIERVKSSISQEETGSESNSPNIVNMSPELKVGSVHSVHKELMYSVSDTFAVKPEKEKGLSKYKTCLNPQFDDGDYMDGMDENHDIVIKSPYVRDFEAYFMGKTELRKMSKKI